MQQIKDPDVQTLVSIAGMLRKDYVRNGIMTPGLSAHSDGLGHVPPGSAAGSASSLWLVGVRQKDLMSRQAETQR